MNITHILHGKTNMNITRILQSKVEFTSCDNFEAILLGMLDHLQYSISISKNSF